MTRPQDSAGLGLSRGADGTRCESKVVHTGWHVVGVTTTKQLFIAPPQPIILMRAVD
jgi:hypothetical protein